MEPSCICYPERYVAPEAKPRETVLSQKPRVTKTFPMLYITFSPSLSLIFKINIVLYISPCITIKHILNEKHINNSTSRGSINIVTLQCCQIVHVILMGLSFLPGCFFFHREKRKYYTISLQAVKYHFR